MSLGVGSGWDENLGNYYIKTQDTCGTTSRSGRFLRIGVEIIQYFVLMTYAPHESRVEQKFELFQQFGWSKGDFVAAIMRFPNCVKISDEKIKGTMNYLVNNVGLQPHAIAMQPFVLGLSLEKRIKPRNMVISELLSKEFVKKEDLNYFQILKIKECVFIDKFVVKFRQVSSLLKPSP
ncbi:unnamed protein product [Arabis nemorensis]|uniref:Uncharacterized protein n=1 Tax=Arabis nemorensis TaxID=586526 RepID=A0A565BZA8_9BRAS|nr:unnamed protein product [Arabis nemorensis]